MIGMAETARLFSNKTTEPKKAVAQFCFQGIRPMSRF